MSSEIDTRPAKQSQQKVPPVVDPYYDEYDDDSDRYDEYRTISISAVTTLLLGIMSFGALLFPAFLIIPAVGTVLGCFAVWTVSTRRDEFTGGPLAVAGLTLSATLLVLGTGLHWWLNRIEVPEGYEEVSFWELQPEQDIDLQELARLRNRNIDLPLPPKAVELDGQRVFVTGYVYPGAQREGLTKFVLVPDMGTCCFGGQPKLTDMIEIQLEGDLTADFSYRRRGLGGTLRVHHQMQERDQLTGVVYQLKADYLY